VATAIAFVVVLMLGILASVFVRLALAIRRDFRIRFVRVADKLEHDALRILRHVLSSPSDS
jgi:hypothetical protein